MKVSALITALQSQSPDANVHTDEDDYPHVVGIKTSMEYDGPEEYTPPSNTVLLLIDFPKE